MRAPNLALALISALAVACGRGDTPPAGQSPTTPAPTGTSTAATSPPASAPTETVAGPAALDPAEFQRLEQGWAEALAAKDRATLEYLLAPEFIITGVGSTAADPVGGRAEWLEKVPQHPWPLHEVLDVRLAQAAPDVVVVKCTWKGDYPPASITDAGGSISLLETDVWVKRNGKWLVVARHTSLPRPE